MYFLLKMWGFVLPLWTYVLVGFCPRGFCPRGFCPRGFCPTLETDTTRSRNIKLVLRNFRKCEFPRKFLQLQKVRTRTTTNTVVR